jgi:hypothetical protein
MATYGTIVPCIDFSLRLPSGYLGYRVWAHGLIVMLEFINKSMRPDTTLKVYYYDSGAGYVPRPVKDIAKNELYLFRKNSCGADENSCAAVSFDIMEDEIHVNRAVADAAGQPTAETNVICMISFLEYAQCCYNATNSSVYIISDRMVYMVALI